MKKIKLILLSVSFISFSLFAQREITTKWYHDTYNPYFEDTLSRKYSLPYDLIEKNAQELILATHDFSGWSIKNINRFTGLIKWTNHRTAWYPDTTRKQYLFDNLMLRTDGDFEILGVKSSTSPSAAPADGNPIKIIYDINTGKEKKVHFPQQKNNYAYNVTKPGSKKSYMLMEDKSGYYTINRVRFGNAFFSLTRLDTNLIIKDTLAFLDEGKVWEDYPTQTYNVSPPQRINNHIYLMTAFWRGFGNDTSAYRHYFYKISTTGEKKIVKDIARSLYYRVNYLSYKRISDGFLFSGFVDTTYKQFANAEIASNTSLAAKIDTNGNVNWRTFLIKPEAGSLNILASCEDIKRNGYWAMAGDLGTRYPFLYFIDKNGKAKFIAKIKIGNNPFPLSPADLWVLKDGNLFLSYYYNQAEKDYKFAKSWGVSLIESAELDKILATSEPDILPSFLVNIYPNPAQDILNVSVADSDEQLQIECFDLQGRAIYRCDFQSFTQINTSDWQRGLYAYVIRDTRGRLVKSDKVIME